MNTTNFQDLVAAARNEADTVATVKALNRKFLREGYSAADLGLTGGATGRKGSKKKGSKKKAAKDEHFDNEYDMFTVPDTILQPVGDETLIYDGEDEESDEDD